MMGLQQNLDRNKGHRSFVLTAISILLLLLGSLTHAEQLETKSSPNYLIILVHGINTTSRVYMGHGENGSDVSKIPDDEKYPFGDLKGYLENLLDVPPDSYVHAYTFSERDGHIELMAKELGDPNWDNKAATIGGTLHYDKVGKEIAADKTGITDTTWSSVEGKFLKTGKGNSWFEQAREDFIIWFKTEGPGKDRAVKEPLPAEIPN